MIIKSIKKQIRISPKSGHPYASIQIQVEEYKDGKGNMRWISGFGNKYTWAWKIGDDVQPEITEKDGKYLNFSFREDEEDARLDVYRLPATIGFVMDLLKGKSQNKQSSPEAEELPDDDIPF